MKFSHYRITVAIAPNWVVTFFMISKLVCLNTYSLLCFVEQVVLIIDAQHACSTRKCVHAKLPTHS